MLSLQEHLCAAGAWWLITSSSLGGERQCWTVAEHCRACHPSLLWGYCYRAWLLEIPCQPHNAVCWGIWSCHGRICLTSVIKLLYSARREWRSVSFLQGWLYLSLLILLPLSTSWDTVSTLQHWVSTQDVCFFGHDDILKEECFLARTSGQNWYRTKQSLFHTCTLPPPLTT